MYSDDEINSTHIYLKCIYIFLNDTHNGIVWYEIRHVDGSSRIIRKADKCSVE
jgi:hypothetical protein